VLVGVLVRGCGSFAGDSERRDNANEQESITEPGAEIQSSRSGSWKSAEQERSWPARGGCQQCDKPEDFIPLFVRPVYELHPFAAGTAVCNPDREIEADILKCDVDRSGDIDGKRFAHFKLHAIGADLRATSELC